MKKLSSFRILIVLCLVLALACSEAYAWGGGWHGGGRGYHYYRGGRWYQHGWFWFDTAVAALTLGALVDTLPPRYTTVVYSGVTYYYSDGYYYRPYDYGGYMVVAPPVMAQPVVVQQQAPVVMQQQAPVVEAPQPPAAQYQSAQVSDTVTINIPNKRGGYTSVTLKKAGNGYVGPQGEYYSENPTVEQLKTLYGGK
jgi:hypothetical protein